MAERQYTKTHEWLTVDGPHYDHRPMRLELVARQLVHVERIEVRERLGGPRERIVIAHSTGHDCLAHGTLLKQCGVRAIWGLDPGSHT